MGKLCVYRFSIDGTGRAVDCPVSGVWPESIENLSTAGPYLSSRGLMSSARREALNRPRIDRQPARIDRSTITSRFGVRDRSPTRCVSPKRCFDRSRAAGYHSVICSPLDTPQGLGRGYFVSGLLRAD